MRSKNEKKSPRRHEEHEARQLNHRDTELWTFGVVERWSAGKRRLQAGTCLSLLHTARSANLDPIPLLQTLLLEGHAPVAAALFADSCADPVHFVGEPFAF
jgi:hypothetical protein